MSASVEDMARLLVSSQLLKPEEVKTLWVRWQHEAGKGLRDPARFGAWLVANRFATDYQAKLLASGKGLFFLNQYKLLDRLGAGPTAAVFKAVHWIGQVVAIKVLPPSKVKDRQVLERFHREARLAVKLIHPHIIRTFQIDQTPEGIQFIVMEYLEGETLEKLLARKKRLPLAQAADILLQTLEGLQYLHEQGLVHRDLEPGNLMLLPPAGQSENCRVKILDIGLARTLFHQDLGEANEGQGLTAQGVLLGTPQYMAPEQALDAHEADIRADIYSAGCIFFHALTGRPPFMDKSVVKLIARHQTEVPPPLKDFDPSLGVMQEVMSRMLAKEPRQRYASPWDAAEALRGALARSRDTDILFSETEEIPLVPLDDDKKPGSAPPPLEEDQEPGPYSFSDTMVEADLSPISNKTTGQAAPPTENMPDHETLMQYLRLIEEEGEND